MTRNFRRHRGAALLSLILAALTVSVAGLSAVPAILADSVPKEPVQRASRPSAARPLPATPEAAARPSAPPKPAGDGGPSNSPAPAETGGEDPSESEPMLVNKTKALPEEYVPADLRPVEIPFSFAEDSPKRMMRDEAADALERLFAEARRDGIELAGVSGYRSYATQAAIFAHNAERYGSEEAANRVSARPGESEHQTGLAMDVSAPSVGYQLTEALGSTEEGLWLAENAPRFGFIIRYPQGKEGVTGYQYEPWHLRYVGEQHAARIAGEGVTLEEYLA